MPRACALQEGSHNHLQKKYCGERSDSHETSRKVNEAIAFDCGVKLATDIVNISVHYRSGNLYFTAFMTSLEKWKRTGVAILHFVPSKF